MKTIIYQAALDKGEGGGGDGVRRCERVCLVVVMWNPIVVAKGVFLLYVCGEGTYFRR